MYSPEVQMKIEAFRRKAADGTVTLEEMREAVLLMRSERRSAAMEATSKPRSGRSAPRSADSLLSDLEGLAE